MTWVHVLIVGPNLNSQHCHVQSNYHTGIKMYTIFKWKSIQRTNLFRCGVSNGAVFWENNI